MCPLLVDSRRHLKSLKCANSGHSARLCVLTGSNPKHAFLVGHGTGGIRQECAIPLVP
jgi:hypothetical protein